MALRMRSLILNTQGLRRYRRSPFYLDWAKVDIELTQPGHLWTLQWRSDFMKVCCLSKVEVME